MVGHAVQGRVQRTDHALGHTGFDGPDASESVEMSGWNTKRLLDAGTHLGLPHVVIALVELQVPHALVSRGRTETLMQRRPEVVRLAHERQFADVAAIGTDAALAETAGRPGCDLPGFKHDDGGPACRQ